MTAVTSRIVTTALPTPTPTLGTLRLLPPRQTRPTDVKSCPLQPRAGVALVS